MAEDPPSPPADPSRSVLRHAAVKGASWSLLQAWVGRLISTVAFFVLARLLVPEDFGVVALAMIFVELGQMLMNRGFGASIVQREDVSETDLDSVFWFSLVVGTALTAITWPCAGMIAEALGEPEFAPVLRALSINWILAAFWTVPQNVMQRELRFAGLAIRRMLAVSISGVAAIVLAFAGAGVWSLVAMTTLQSLVSIVVLWSACSWRPSMRWSWDSIGSMRGFATRIVAIDVTQFFSTRGEGLLIGAFLGPVSLGFYAIAERFLTLLRELFASSIGNVAFPVFSRLQDDRERRSRALISVVRLTSLAAFPAFVGLAVLAPEVVEVTLGPTWEPSVILIQLLCIQGIRTAVTYCVSGVVVSTGDAGLQLRITIFGVVIRFAVLIVGVQFGVDGVAAAAAVSSILTLPVTFYGVRRVTDFTARGFLRQTVEPATASAVMAVVVAGSVAWLDGLVAPIVVLGAGLAVGAITYLGVLLVIGRGLLGEARAIFRDLRAGRAPIRGRVAPAAAP